MAGKKITKTQMKNIIKKIEAKTNTVEWEDITFDVKEKLKMSNIIEMVVNIVDTCFDDTTGEYHPEAKEFALRTIILENYTNIPVPNKQDGSRDLDMLFDLVFNESLYGTIKNNIDAVQYDIICNSVNEKIQYNIQSNISIIRDEILDMYKGIEELANMLGDAFNGVTTEDLEALKESIGAGDFNFDEEKAMKAYLNAKNGENGVILPMLKK